MRHEAIKTISAQLPNDINQTAQTTQMPSIVNENVNHLLGFTQNVNVAMSNLDAEKRNNFSFAEEIDFLCVL